jgi:hypothetical protein
VQPLHRPPLVSSIHPLLHGFAHDRSGLDQCTFVSFAHSITARSPRAVPGGTSTTRHLTAQQRRCHTGPVTGTPSIGAQTASPPETAMSHSSTVRPTLAVPGATSIILHLTTQQRRCQTGGTDDGPVTCPPSIGAQPSSFQENRESHSISDHLFKLFSVFVDPHHSPRPHLAADGHSQHTTAPWIATISLSHPPRYRPYRTSNRWKTRVG